MTSRQMLYPKVVFWFVLVFLSAGLSANVVHAGTPAEELQEEFIRVAEKVKPSVVGIRAERRGNVPASPRQRRDPDDEDGDARVAFGTGVIVQADGIILTNSHVIRGANTIWVLLDAERRDEEIARVLGVDLVSDLAVLKVERNGLKPVELGDSDALKVGAWVIAVGNPFRQFLSVTAGIVSGKGRHLTERQSGRPYSGLQDYIQTDAAINQGNSGGPLVDLKGRLVGINTVILSTTGGNIGIGFAVPVSTVKKLLPRLMRGETIARGFLGILYGELSRKEAQALGLSTQGFQVNQVVDKSPASEAGVQAGDVIVGYADRPAGSTDAFREKIAESPPGTRLPLRVVRFTEEGAKELTLTVTLRERERSAADDPPPSTLPERKSLLGMRVEDATPRIRGELKIRSDKEGAIITHIEPGGPADEAGAEEGRFVRKVKIGSAKAFTLIRRTQDFEKLLEGIKPGTIVVLWVESPDESSGQYLSITAKPMDK